VASNSSRRSGHSRKAQYSLFTGYALAAIGALIGAVLLAVSLFNPTSFSGLRSVSVDVATPPGELVAETRTGSNSLLEEIAAFWRAGTQNAELRNEVELARIRLAEFEAVAQENRELKQLLQLEEAANEIVTVTRLVGSTSSSGRRFAYLGAGSRNGIGIGMPVRSARGIVGRILEVGNNSSRVLLLTDSESVLPVRRAGDDVVAFAEGRGDGVLRIRLINLGLNPLNVGDLFVTSGAGGYFRPGIAVAILEEITADGGNARVIADPASANIVAVDPIWVPEAVQAAQTPQSERLGQESPAQ
jgi:rod shape-determining protein MreC